MSKQLYKVILDVLPQAILVLNKDLRVIVCNQRCESFFLKSIEDIVGKKLSEITYDEELASKAKVVLQDAKVETKFVEFHLDIKKESPKILRATITPFHREDFGIPSCLVMLEDITGQVELEEKVLQSEKLAGMGLLARRIVHELGNPLSIMTSTLQYVQPILENINNQEVTETMETLRESAHQMYTLLQNLSDFSSSKRPQFEVCKFHQILLQLFTLISKEAEMHNISIQKEFDDRITGCDVDKQQIRQLFLNLFKNAIEAMPRGGKLYVKTCLAPKDSPENEDRVLVEISDSGEGISKAEMQYIFKPFYSTKPRGTGLGLSFCRRVAEEHEGELLVKSELRKGTTFMVSLPVKQTNIRDYAKN
ncbi:PAS domain-containing protein [Candidatus Aerophobetes bacterium]|nr:PAS domain-containing protein [Candidatus Aerophobetes bacterium]